MERGKVIFSSLLSVNSEDRSVRPGEIGVLKTSAVSYGRFDPLEHKAVIPADVARVRIAPRKDGIIISRMNTQALVGASAYVERDYPHLFLPDRLWQAVFKDPNTFSARWLSCVLASPAMRERMSAMAVGTSGSMKNLSKGQLLSLEINIPPLSEQRKIASVLSSVDDAIETTQAIICQLEVVKQGVLGQLLKNGMPRRHTDLKKTELGALPASWKVGTIADVGTVVTGSTPSTKESSFWVGTIPFVTPGDLGKTRHVLTAERTVTEKGAKVGRMLPEGAVLMTCIGATIGKHGIARTRCLTNQQINAVICNEKMDPDFLFYALAISGDKLRASAGTTAVPIVSKSRYEQLAVPIPSLAEQREIATALASLDQAIDGNGANLEQIRLVKDGLLPALLSGRIRVTGVTGGAA